MDPPVHGYGFNVQVWERADKEKPFVYCGQGRFCKNLGEAEVYADGIDGGHRHETRMFEWYKKDIINSCRIASRYTGSEKITRFSPIQYVCHFPGIDPVKMAASLQMDGFTILYDDSSISAKENDAYRKAVEAAVQAAQAEAEAEREGDGIGGSQSPEVVEGGIKGQEMTTEEALRALRTMEMFYDEPLKEGAMRIAIATLQAQAELEAEQEIDRGREEATEPDEEMEL